MKCAAKPKSVLITEEPLAEQENLSPDRGLGLLSSLHDDSEVQISRIPRPIKELAFFGSIEELESFARKLLRKV